jgi:hypothetical protein
MPTTTHERAANGGSSPHLSAEDVARLDTWLPEIAERYLGKVQLEANGDYRVGGNRGLVIHPNGVWHNFAAVKSSHGALQLLTHLGGGPEEALSWLAEHEGDGRLGRVTGDTEEAAKKAKVDAYKTAFIKELWSGGEPLAGTPAEIYLRSRGLTPEGVPLLWVSDWRSDEGSCWRPSRTLMAGWLPYSLRTSRRRASSPP